MKFITILLAVTISATSAAKNVSDFSGILNSAPVHTPTHYVPDGAIAGNGDIGIVLGGTSSSPQIYLSKTDFWKAKTGFPNGGVCAIGRLSIATGITDSLSYSAIQSISDATVTGKFLNKEGNGYSLKIWCSADSNIVITQINALGSPLVISSEFKPLDGLDSKTEKYSAGKSDIHIRSFEGKDLVWPTAAAVSLRYLGKNGISGSVRLNPGDSTIIVMSVCTNHDSGISYRIKAGAITDRLDSNSLSKLRKSHTDWWNNFWDKSEINIDDPVLEKYYYGSQYLLACCSRNTDFPPGLWGTSLTKDATGPGWAGDYHTNYNYQAAWWGAYSSNHLELTDCYDAPILDYMKAGKSHAHNFLGKRGVYLPVGIGPKGFCSSMFPLTSDDMMKQYGTPDNDIENGYMFLGQKSNAVFCTANMFMRFYSTYDEAYARKVYPFIREVADFWEDWLVWENGRYVSYDDNFWEVGPWEGKDWKDYYGDINPTVSLGLCRMLFSGILDMSSFLGRDSDKHKKWKHILSHLSEIPTTVDEDENVTRVLVCESGSGSGKLTAPGMGRVCLHGLVYPSGAFGPIRHHDFSALMLDEIGRWDKPVEGYPFRDTGWENMSNGFEVYFPAAARLGFDGDSLLNILKSRINRTGQQNLWVTQGGGGVETLSAIPSCINEMLMQSYEGVLRVFPVWNRLRKASFRNLRAYGAFLVSAECDKGKVKSLTITSEKGRPCRLENPWPGESVVVRRADGSVSVLHGDTVEFTTSEGETIMINSAPDIH